MSFRPCIYCAQPLVWECGVPKCPSCRLTVTPFGTIVQGFNAVKKEYAKKVLPHPDLVGILQVKKRAITDNPIKPIINDNS
jgi:hypothetical protein